MNSGQSSPAVERRARVALETTLLVHGVPRDDAAGLARELGRVVRENGAEPALVGVLKGRAIVGMTEGELAEVLAAAGRGGDRVPKLNSANLGVALARGWTGATTVSATMELAASRGVKVFATGGIGGVHEGYGQRWDVSADLLAFTSFPVAVVTAGVKSILDVAATREMLETLGVPVVGYRTDEFPAFYLRSAGAGERIGVDARFDDVEELAAYVRRELVRSGRGIVVCNSIPAEHEVPRAEWEAWLATARAEAARAGVAGRGVTPFVLGRLHEVSGGATLRANIALVKHNAAVAGRLAAALARPATRGC
jgi:pseudouridine-5'-phosphate glycosidase